MIIKFEIFENLSSDKNWFVNILKLEFVENEYNKIKKYGVEDFHFFINKQQKEEIIIIIYTNNENKYYHFNEYINEDYSMISKQLSKENYNEINNIEEWISINKYNL